MNEKNKYKEKINPTQNNNTVNFEKDIYNKKEGHNTPNNMQTILKKISLSILLLSICIATIFLILLKKTNIEKINAMLPINVIIIIASLLFMLCIIFIIINLKKTKPEIEKFVKEIKNNKK